MSRAVGILFGVGTHLVFALTVWHLVRFLAGFAAARPGDSELMVLAVDAGLAVQFAISHSVLLHPNVREWLGKWIPGPFYGCFYCCATCLSLLWLFSCWRASPVSVWAFEGPAALAIQIGFVLSWVGLLHSLSLTGLGWQTGLTPWLAWVRRRPAPRREFRPRSSYRLMRHPVYLSFLGLVWLTPVVSRDRAALIALWTVYIFVGSWLKDRRLEYYLGDTYREYQSRVPGYPFIPVGPLARVPLAEAAADPADVPAHSRFSRLWHLGILLTEGTSRNAPRDCVAERENRMKMYRDQFRMLALYLALSVPLVAWGAIRAMRMNANSPIDWVAPDYGPRVEFDAFRKTFGSGDVVIAGWPGCRVDAPELDDITRSLRGARAFQLKEGVPAFEAVVSGRALVAALEVEPLAVDRGAAIDRLRGTLIGPDGVTTCMVIAFRPEAIAARKELLHAIRRVIQKHGKVPDEEIHLAGPILDGLAVDEAGRRSLDRFALPSAVVVLLACWWCLRSFRDALLVFGVALYSQAVTLAVVDFCGDTMSALLIVMPPLVQVLAVSAGVHLVNYHRDAERTLPPDEAALAGLAAGWLPSTLSALTTIIGLVSMLPSGLSPIRAFGAYAGIGVFVAWGVSLLMIPGTLAALSSWGRSASSLRPLPELSKGGDGRSTAEVGIPGTSFADRFWRGFGSLVTGWHGPIVVLALLAMGLLGWGLQRVEASVRIETLFDRESRILRDYAWLERHVGPLVPIEILVEFPTECDLSTRDRLATLVRIQALLKNQSEVGGMLSAVTFLPDMRRDPALTPSEWRTEVEAMLDMVRPQFTAVKMLAGNDDGSETWRISARVAALGNMDYGRFLDGLRATITPALNDRNGKSPPGVQLRLTGIMPFVHRVQGLLVADLFASFLSALVVIAITMTIVQGGLGTGLVAMVSNLFPTALLFGLLGWLRMPLDIGSIMTACVALGMAIDNTLHFLTFFRRSLSEGRARLAAIDSAFRHCGTSMVQSTLVCGLGLAVFAGSDFVPTCRFSWMMCILLTAVLVGDLVVLPALLAGPLGRWFEVGTRSSVDRIDLDLNGDGDESPGWRPAMPLADRGLELAPHADLDTAGGVIRSAPSFAVRRRAA
jgi:predicted RND superfamily exporter protein